MTVALLPELALGTARVAREIAPGQASAELVDALLVQTRLLLQIVRDDRDVLAAELDRKGMDPQALLAVCRVALATLDQTTETRRLLSRLLTKSEQREEWERQEEAAAAERRAFLEWQEMAGRPFPPIDRERLRRGVEATARGELVRVETYEDLFGEPPGA